MGGCYQRWIVVVAVFVVGGQVGQCYCQEDSPGHQCPAEGVTLCLYVVVVCTLTCSTRAERIVWIFDR